MTKKQLAIDLTTEIRNKIEAYDDRFDSMTVSAIDEIIVKFAPLRVIMSNYSDLALALKYLERMKGPGADKQWNGQRAKDAIVGLCISASISE